MTVFLIIVCLVFAAAGCILALLLRNTQEQNERYKKDMTAMRSENYALVQEANARGRLITQLQEAQRAHETELARLRAGSPADRFAASLDVLRDYPRARPKPAP